MDNNHQTDDTDIGMLMERIRTLELKEKIHLCRRSEWKKREHELDAMLRLKTGELAVLSEMLNSYLDRDQQSG